MATESLNVDNSLVNITIRLIMQGKEVGSIIGKKGDNIKKIRFESGAKINISDGTYAERIVTVTGSIKTILKAFSSIAQKFEEQNIRNNQKKSIVTLKLIVPASQCGSLIGKGGSKIKEIREVTGASIQVASAMLYNSTERAVILAGTSESIIKCIYQICSVMIESPPKGATIPYRPKSTLPPVIFAGGQAYTIQGQYAVHQPDLTKLHQLALQHSPLIGHNVGSLNPQVASLVSANCLRSTSSHLTPQTALIVASAPLTVNMSILNEVIGCIIGKGGSKINEIRQLSGATIKIKNPENALKFRTVSITGTSESVNLAQYLIHSSMEMHKNLSVDTNTSSQQQNQQVESNQQHQQQQQQQENNFESNKNNNTSKNISSTSIINSNQLLNSNTSNNSLVVDNVQNNFYESSSENSDALNSSISTINNRIKSNLRNDLIGINKEKNDSNSNNTLFGRTNGNANKLNKLIRKFAPY